jgi:hypothetical protein
MTYFEEDNFCKYSIEWQPYKGDYDKFEYDIKLKDGTVVTNCYPNADKFHSISKEFNGKTFHADTIAEIRFTPEDKQKFGINPDGMYKQNL